MEKECVIEILKKQSSLKDNQKIKDDVDSYEKEEFEIKKEEESKNRMKGPNTSEEKKESKDEIESAEQNRLADNVEQYDILYTNTMNTRASRRTRFHINNTEDKEENVIEENSCFAALMRDIAENEMKEALDNQAKKKVLLRSRDINVLLQELEKSNKIYMSNLLEELMLVVEKRKKNYGSRQGVLCEDIYETKEKEQEQEQEQKVNVEGIMENEFTELSYTSINAEWAFQQFCGKKIDASVSLDIDILNYPGKRKKNLEKIHGYSVFQKESAKNRFQRLMNEIPEAIRVVKGYSDYLKNLKEKEQMTMCESNADFVYKLNKILADGLASVDKYMRNFVANNKDIQNFFFGDEQNSIEMFNEFVPHNFLSLYNLTAAIKAEGIFKKNKYQYKIPIIDSDIHESKNVISQLELRKSHVFSPFDKYFDENKKIYSSSPNSFIFIYDLMIPEKIKMQDKCAKLENLLKRIQNLHNQVSFEVLPSNLIPNKTNLIDNICEMHHRLELWGSEDALSKLQKSLHVILEDLNLVEGRKDLRVRKDFEFEIPDEWTPEMQIENLLNHVQPYHSIAMRLEDLLGQTNDLSNKFKMNVDFLKQLDAIEVQQELLAELLKKMQGTLKTINETTMKQTELLHNSIKTYETRLSKILDKRDKLIGDSTVNECLK